MTDSPDVPPNETDDRVARRARNLLPEEEAAESEDPEAQAAAILNDSDARSTGQAADGARPIEHRTSDEATEPVD